MTLDPILSAPPVIQLHVAAALVAVALTPLTLWRGRRDRWHRRAGKAWVTAMAALALTGLAIPAQGLAVIGPFGPIHLFCPWVLWGLWQAVRAARAGRIGEHRDHMRGMAWGALAIAGTLTFLPGRTMNAVLVPDRPELGWVLAALGLAAAAWAVLRGRLPRRRA